MIVFFHKMIKRNLADKKKRVKSKNIMFLKLFAEELLFWNETFDEFYMDYSPRNMHYLHFELVRMLPFLVLIYFLMSHISKKKILESSSIILKLSKSFHHVTILKY